MTKEKKEQETLLAGIDVGSTTTKVAVIDPETGRILFFDYRRHHADQVKSIAFVLNALKEHFPGRKFQTALTGSGAKPIAEKLKLTFIQEVAANAEALKTQYPSIGTAIELGGQDAKMIFFPRGRYFPYRKCGGYADEQKLCRRNRRFY